MADGELELAGGRRMAYAEWGGPDGPAVIYCHGSPGNRRELDVAGPALERLAAPARLVALNRPGYGPSTFVSGHRFTDWPSDVAVAADRLGIDRFAVVGASGGSPYALACAAALGDRVTRVGIVVGVAPLAADGMDRSALMTGPSSRRWLCRLQYELVAAGLRGSRHDRVIDRMIATLGEVDRAALADPTLRRWFEAVCTEAFAKGGRAAAGEVELYRRPWGVDLAAIRAETLLWYGGLDRSVPATAGRWLADRLPRSSYVLWPHHGHFSWVVGDELLEVIAAVADPSHRSGDQASDAQALTDDECG